MANEWWKRPELAFIYGEKQQQQNPSLPTEAVGYTGKGPDGITQVDRRTPGMGNGDYDAHENEFIFDSNSTSAIGADILTDVMEASKNGNLDHNKIREAIGQPGKPGRQTGGLSPTTGTPEPVKRNTLTPVNTEAATPGPIKRPVAQSAIGAPQQPKPMAPTPEGQQGDIINIDPMKDIKIDPIKPDVQTGTQIDPTDYLKDIMGGDNPYIDAIKKQAAQDIGGAGAAGTAAIKQEAAQAGMSPEQIASMGVTRQRDVEEQAGDVVGDIATAEAQMGVDAARDVFSQQFAEKQFQYQQDMNQFNQQLAQGDYTNAAQTFNKIHGTDIDFSKAIEKENLANFNNSMNNMTSSIANNMSFDDWMTTAQADGTFDKLNMTESDAKMMYENMRLQQNPIYQASQRYQDLVDQGIISQDQMDDILAIQSYLLSHPDGISVTDSFQVTNAQGNEIGNFKTKEEADAFMAENPGSKINILKNGWVETTGVGTVTGDGEIGTSTYSEYKAAAEAAGETPLSEEDWKFVGNPKYTKLSPKEQHNRFLESLPEDLQDEWGYDAWKKKGSPYNYSIAERDFSDPGLVPEIEKYAKEFRESGWPTYTNTQYLGQIKEWLDEGRESFLNKQDQIKTLNFEDIFKEHGNPRDGNVKKSILKSMADTNDVAVIDGTPYRVYKNYTGTNSSMMALVVDLKTGLQKNIIWNKNGIAIKDV